MKTSIILCVSCFIVNYSLCQKNNLEFSYYNYNTINKYNNWKWFSSSYNFITSKNWSFGFGIGYNITPLFVNNVIYLNPIPKSKNQINHLNINSIARYHIDLKKENINLYVYDKINFNRTPFIETDVYSVNDVVYYQNIYSSNLLFIDNTMGIGLNVSFIKQTHIFIRSGIVFYFHENSSIKKKNLNINSEFGIKIDLLNRKDKLKSS